MGTGVTPKRIATKNSLLSYLAYCPRMRYTSSVLTTSQLRCSLELSPPMSGPPLRKTLSSKLARFPCIVPTHSLLNSQTVKQPLLYFLRKEVIQPHLPIRLPCYDFTPVIIPAFGGSLLTVGSPTSGIYDSHGVTGGVYKTRERIHRSILICDY